MREFRGSGVQGLLCYLNSKPIVRCPMLDPHVLELSFARKTWCKYIVLAWTSKKQLLCNYTETGASPLNQENDGMHCCRTFRVVVGVLDNREWHGSKWFMKLNSCLFIGCIIRRRKQNASLGSSLYERLLRFHGSLFLHTHKVGKRGSMWHTIISDFSMIRSRSFVSKPQPT